MLQNRRYLGIYLYKGQETPGGMPQIVPEDLFYKVQQILAKNSYAPCSLKSKAGVSINHKAILR